jgi:transposase
MWYAGIDWADQHHDVVVIDDQGAIVLVQRVAHSVAGLQELVNVLRAFGDVALHPEQLACIIEISHGILITALLEAGLYVYPVPSDTVARRRKSAGSKTDRVDATLLARMGRSDLLELRRLRPDGPIIRELKVLTRDQDRLISAQTRVLNQLTACLKSYFPVALDLFAQLHQQVTVAFLRAFPTLEHVQAATEAQIAEVLRAVHYSHDADHKAQQVAQRVHAPQLRPEPCEARAKSRYMLAVLAQLETLMGQIAEYDKAIAQLWKEHPDHAIFASLPGIGRRLGPRLLAEWGEDRTRYQDAASVQALAGTAPVLYQSGNYSHTRVRRACTKPFRRALFLFAHETILAEPWARAYYERKRQAGKTYTMALRALANHWVRIMFALWKKHECYDPATFREAQQRHARSVA